MKIFFNCSINVVGGAVQNAANFIKYALRDERHEYLFVVSNPVYTVLSSWGLESGNIHVYDSPARNRDAAKKIKHAESFFKPDIVYTMAGPTYIRFGGLHVMGVSDPYITHADWQSLFLNRSLFSAVTFGVKEFFKGWYSRFTAKYFLFQTETSRDGFCKKYFLSREKTKILPNSLGANFYDYDYDYDYAYDRCVFIKNRKKFKIFVPSAYYAHKNLEIIFSLCSVLKSMCKYEFIFITTVPTDSSFVERIRILGLGEFIHNIGPYSYNDAYELYLDCDIVFIPSILETFSTSYLEAIAMARPLVVADKFFSREVCGDYANYYAPLSVSDAANSIISSFSSDINFVERDRIVSTYGSQFQRFENIISIFEDIFIGDVNV